MNKKIILALALIAVVALAADSPAVTAGSTATCNIAATTSQFYFWSNDVCYACPAGCTGCTSATTCDACVAGWSKRSSTDASLGCYNAAKTAVDGTTTFTNASALSTSACTTDCVDLTNKTYACSKCATGYGMWANGCTACTAANCATCAFTAATTSTCSACSVGYYLTSAGACTLCPTTITNCFQCNTDGTTCKTCNTGYYNSGANGTCVACLGATCDSTGKVLTCADGYFLDSTVVATPKCTACGSNCRVCTTAAACTTCNSGSSSVVANDWRGYYLAAGVCTACPTNSLYCTSTDVVQCAPGYTKGATNTCVAAIAHCL